MLYLETYYQDERGGILHLTQVEVEGNGKHKWRNSVQTLPLKGLIIFEKQVQQETTFNQEG